MTEATEEPRPAQLFRQEAMHHHAQRLHGNVQIYTPMSWHIVGLLLLALLITGGLFLSYASYSKVQTVPGVVTWDKVAVDIAASRAGTISRVRVTEGQAVRTGQELAEIRIIERPVGGGDASDGGRSFPSARSASEGRPHTASTPIKRRGPAGEAVRADHSKGHILIAPADGVVTAMRARAGAFVEPGRPLMAIVPLASRTQVNLYVPSEIVGFISVGDEVKLSPDAPAGIDTVPVPARVISVARFPTIRSDGKALRPVHVVTVSVPQPWVEAVKRERAILPGVTLSARIVTEKRTLIEWLFAPLLEAGEN